MALEFTAENRERIRTLQERYPDKRSTTLPVLHIAQEQFGTLTPDVINLVADAVDETSMHVRDTISFYTMFHTKERGKYHLQVCHTLSCSLRGSEEVVEHLYNKLDFNEDGITGDKMFSIEKVECLGACGTAPVVQINNDYYEQLTVERLDEIIDKLQASE